MVSIDLDTLIAAKRAFASGEFGAAAAILDTLNGEIRTGPSYLYLRGLCHGAEGRLQASFVMLQESAKQAPGSADVWSALAHIAWRCGELRIAQAAVTYSLSLNPIHGDALAIASRLKLKSGNHAHSCELARRRFVSSGGEDAVRWAVRMSMESGEVDQLCRILSWAYDHVPTSDPDLEYYMVYAISRGGLLNEHEAKTFLEDIYKDHQRGANAAALRRAGRLSYWIASVRFENRTVDRTKEFLRQCLVLNPGYALAWRDIPALGCPNRETSGIDRCLTRAWVAAAGASAELRANIQRCIAEHLARTDRPQQSCAAYEKAARLIPLDPQDSLPLAAVRLLAGDREGAWRSLASVLVKGTVERWSLEAAAAQDYCCQYGEGFVQPTDAAYVDLTTNQPKFRRISYRTPPCFVARLQDVTTIPGPFSLMTEDGRLLVDQLSHTALKGQHQSPRCCYVSSGKAIAAVLCGRTRHFEEAILLGGGSNHFHNLLDWASRAYVIEKWGQDPGLPIVISYRTSNVMVDLLNRLGLDPSRLIRHPETPVTYSRLWVPSLTHNRSGFVPPDFLEFLERRLSPRKRGTGSLGTRRLFISRRGAIKRTLVNETDIEETLFDMGFKTIRTETMTLDAQISVFAEAEAIVGVHGAGLANVVIAPRTCRVVELTQAGAEQAIFPMLCALRGQPFAQISGPATLSGGQDRFHSDIWIDPNKLTRELNALSIS